VLRANAWRASRTWTARSNRCSRRCQLDPRASTQTNLGAIQAARGNLPEAEAAFRQAVVTDPKSVPAQLALWGTSCGAVGGR